MENLFEAPAIYVAEAFLFWENKNVVAEKISHGVSKIMSLQPYSYFLRDSTIQTTRQYGFTAQEIEEVLPELVQTNNKDYKAVNYVQLIPCLTAALQEQQKEIEDLRKQLEVQDELQNRILILEQKLDK